MAYSDLSSVNGKQLINSKKVHICSGATATVLSLYLSYPRFQSAIRTPFHLALHRPHNSMC